MQTKKGESKMKMGSFKEFEVYGSVGNVTDLKAKQPKMKLSRINE